jgi:hypothetical protein
MKNGRVIKKAALAGLRYDALDDFFYVNDG